MDSLLGKHWHHLPPDEVLDLLDTDLQHGLDVFEIKHRQERFGLNLLTPKKGKSPLVRFLLQFNNPLVLILLVASLVTAVLKDPLDALVIFGVVLVNAIIGYLQESHAEHAIAALAEIIGAGDAVIAHFRSVGAIAVEALVNGARIIINTVDRGRYANAIQAGVSGAKVLIIANNGLIHAHTARLAEIFGTGVIILTFKTISATSCTRINGAGIIIRAGESNINGITASSKIGSEKMIVTQWKVDPGNVRALGMIPLLHKRAIVADI